MDCITEYRLGFREGQSEGACEARHRIVEAIIQDLRSMPIIEDRIQVPESYISKLKQKYGIHREEVAWE